MKHDPCQPLGAVDVVSAFGLSLAEARRFAPELERLTAGVKLVAPEELARRRARADDIAANLAIENLLLTDEERDFVDYLDQLDLKPADRDTLRRRYNAARVRTLTLPLAAE
jgi:hypothetical protein